MQHKRLAVFAVLNQILYFRVGFNICVEKRLTDLILDGFAVLMWSKQYGIIILQVHGTQSHQCHAFVKLKL